MAMNFFEHQERARKRTGLLVFIFISGVSALIASTYLIGLLIAMFTSGGDMMGEPVFHLGLFGVSAGVSVLIVGVGWLHKRVQLAAGGRAVAESLGGRVLEPSTGDPDERRVLNIVEEMAIASGVPVPPVYLMNDASINAFAAGYRPQEAVIGVTRGAIAQLSRDELQGVIAHEYSHILNGDMRLNIRLVAAVFGLAALAAVGGTLVRVIGRSGMRSRGGKKDGGGILLVILIAGIGLLILGWIGQLFGRLMQAAVSRQREFLADASAVQFTRNPGGIAGALRRIAASSQPKLADGGAAAEYSHLFFTQALDSFFATHPPLEERIARIEHRAAKEIRADLAAAPAVPVAAAPAVAAPLVRDFSASTRSRAAVSQAANAIGTVPAVLLDYASAARSRLPTGLLAAAHEPYDARALIAALLLSNDDSVQALQIEALRGPELKGVAPLALQLRPAVASMPRDLRLPLVDLCVPALRRLSKDQAAAYAEAVRALVAADRRVDLFEWSVRAVLARAFRAEPATHGGARLAQSVPALTQVLATLAWGGTHDATHAGSAFVAGFIAAGLPAPKLPPREQCTLDALDAAVKSLAALRPIDRDRAVAAFVECVACDETVTVTEAEILRAVVALLGAPMPPVLP